MSGPASPLPPAVAQLLRELPGVTLPPSDGLSAEEWLARCSTTLPREQWVRLAMAVLS